MHEVNFVGVTGVEPSRQSAMHVYVRLGPKRVKVRALLDTGASISVVRSDLSDGLKRGSQVVMA